MTVTAHRLEVLEHERRWSARCSCGFQTVPTWGRSQADARWRIHATEREAMRAYEQTRRVATAASLRTRELKVVREHTVTRRAHLHVERAQMLAAMSVVRREAGREEPPEIVLAAARAMAGITEEELWFDYLGLGGELKPWELRRVLDGSAPLAAIDHDLLAIALNERFADAGFGHPLPVWSAPQSATS
jgi:hypothetical protein